MEDKLYALKEKMVEKYEEYKNKNKDNSILISGYQDCMIEFLENITMEIGNGKKDNK